MRSSRCSPASLVIGAILLGLPCPLSVRAALASQDETSRILLREDIELSRLLDLSATELGVNVEYDPEKLKERVKLRMERGVSAKELWHLTHRLLASRGFTTVQAPGDPTYFLVELEIAPSTSRVMRAPLTEPAPGFVKVLIALEYRSPEEIAKVIGGFLSKHGQASAVPETGELLVSDLFAFARDAISHVEDWDVSSSRIATEEVSLEHISADDVSMLLDEIAQARRGTSGKASRGRVRPLPSKRGVLLVAPEGELEEWRRLISELDRAPSVKTASYEVASLDLDGVVQAIEARFKSGSERDPRSWHVVPDKLTSSVVVTATEAEHVSVADFLDGLSKRSAACASFLFDSKPWSRGTEDRPRGPLEGRKGSRGRGCLLFERRWVESADHGAGLGRSQIPG